MRITHVLIFFILVFGTNSISGTVLCKKGLEKNENTLTVSSNSNVSDLMVLLNKTQTHAPGNIFLPDYYSLQIIAQKIHSLSSDEKKEVFHLLSQKKEVLRDKKFPEPAPMSPKRINSFALSHLLNPYELATIGIDGKEFLQSYFNKIKSLCSTCTPLDSNQLLKMAADLRSSFRNTPSRYSSVDEILLTGSIPSGMSNANSDLDIQILPRATDESIESVQQALNRQNSPELHFLPSNMNSHLIYNSIQIKITANGISVRVYQNLNSPIGRREYVELPVN